MQAPIKSYIAGPALFSNSITLLPPWTPPPTPLLTVLLALLDFFIPYTCQVSVLAVHSAPVCLAVLFPLFSSNIRPFPDHIIKGPGHFLCFLCAIFSIPFITTGFYLTYLVFGLLSASPTHVEREFGHFYKSEPWKV